MAFWMVTPLPAGRVAIRIRSIADRPRRVVREISDVGDTIEEWRCSSCSRWIPHESIKLVASGRVVGGVPEITARCDVCADGSSRAPDGA